MPLHGYASTPQNAALPPSHVELCDQGHIRIPWRFDDECVALRQPKDCLSFSFPQSKVFKEGLRCHDLRTPEAGFFDNSDCLGQRMWICHVTTIPRQQIISTTHTRSGYVKCVCRFLRGQCMRGNQLCRQYGNRLCIKFDQFLICQELHPTLYQIFTPLKALLNYVLRDTTSQSGACSRIHLRVCA